MGINPDNGAFDRVVGVSAATSRTTLQMLSSNTIFTNVALTADGDVWWDGLTDDVPSGLTGLPLSLLTSQTGSAGPGFLALALAQPPTPTLATRPPSRTTR